MGVERTLRCRGAKSLFLLLLCATYTANVQQTDHATKRMRLTAGPGSTGHIPGSMRGVTIMPKYVGSRIEFSLLVFSMQGYSAEYVPLQNTHIWPIFLAPPSLLKEGFPYNQSA